jgi:hypothetical protein
VSKIKAMLESNAGLMPQEREALHTLLVRPYRTLDQVEQAIAAVFPAWFVYRGGSHVALHTRSQSDRLAIWTEERNPRADAIERAVSRTRRMTELERLALVVAVAAPAKWSKYGHAAYIPRAHVDKIRAELERLGVDWRRVQRECEADYQARRAAQQAPA